MADQMTPKEFDERLAHQLDSLKQLFVDGQMQGLVVVTMSESIVWDNEQDPKVALEYMLTIVQDLEKTREVRQKRDGV